MYSLTGYFTGKDCFTLISDSYESMLNLLDFWYRLFIDLIGFSFEFVETE
jgi:hypothetical protein